MVAPYLEFTTFFVNSTSRALAAGARSHSVLRGTLDFGPGSMAAGWMEDEWSGEGVRQVLGVLSPAHPHLSLEAQASVCCSCCKSDLASSCMPVPGSCCRARSVVPGQSSYRRLIRRASHTLSQGAWVAGGEGASLWTILYESQKTCGIAMSRRKQAKPNRLNEEEEEQQRAAIFNGE